MDNAFSFLFHTKCQTSRLTKFLRPRMQLRKTSTRSVCEGGSDPTKLLGGSSAKKWGRSRPIWSVLRGNFRTDSVCKSLPINSLDRGRGEESGEEEAEVCSSYVLHIALLLPSRVSHRILRGTRARQRTKCPNYAFYQAQPLLLRALAKW